MKNILASLLFVLFLTGCKKDVPAEQDSIVTDSIAGTDAEAEPDLKVEDSNAAEFAGGTVTALLDGFKKSTHEPDTLLKPPVVINTQKQKLVFKNINPYAQKGYHDEDEMFYTNLGYSKKIDKHLLFVEYYEGDSYFLIDHATAKTDTINGMPNFSPDAGKMISYYISPYNERKYLLSAEVTVFDLAKNGTVRLHSDTYDYIPCEIRWKGNNTILIKALEGDDYDKMQSDTISKNNYNYLYKKIMLK